MTLTPARTAATVTGLAYVALGAVSLTGSVPDQHWGTRGTVVDLLGLIGFFVNIAAAERLREALALRGIGLGALRVAQIGLLAMSVESVVSLIHGGNIISVVFFVGLLLTLVGLLVVAVVGVMRSSVRWVAPLPFVSLLLGVGAGEHGGFLLPGAVWLVLAFAVIGSPMNHPMSSPAVTGQAQV